MVENQWERCQWGLEFNVDFPVKLAVTLAVKKIYLPAPGRPFPVSQRHACLQHQHTAAKQC